MRSCLALAALAVTLAAPAVAAADCGDAGPNPSIAGMSFAGVQAWNGKPREKEALVFNADCTITFATAGEKTGFATWSQQGGRVTMDFNRHATFVGAFDGKQYVGAMRNPDLTGEFAYVVARKSA